ncbi:hypothetical protein B046DRAFT_02309 [Streptomyces sp. LamerLS-316]|uniref:hypothetical protein n=1 Tax=unclassified Streptomyces TaxID=2593676 RepID=UPI000823C980|nr:MULTISPECIES: hypothetical protein [unclassified Streptomyces]MYQ42109.1 hypothetical protein [Streptomyces sp. SID4921]SCK30424.1 hypothetical protein B046DRAFT_02309 [Streptomyces sp. LamerLS-316]
MRIRKSPSPAVAEMKSISSDDLRHEYELINRERSAGTNIGALSTQNDIVRELERRGER